MIDRRLQRQLDDVALRYRRMRAAMWLAIAWIVLATIAVILVSLNRTVGFYVKGEAVTFVVIGCLVTLGVWLLAMRTARDPHWIARRIEDKYPQLQARLLTAIEQHPELPHGRFGYLQLQVIQEAVFHGYHHDWRRTWPRPAYLASLLFNLLAAGVVVAATAGLFRYLQPQPFRWATLLGVDQQATLPSPTTLVSIDPGDTAIERGTSLLVLAKFAGQLPLDCTLETSDSTGGGQQISMKQSLQDPLFAGRIAAVEQDLRYRIRYATFLSTDYQVTVFEYPALQTADAVLDFPDYTSLGTKTVQDVRHITAVEGTTLTLLCHLNKPVVRAQLRDEEAQAIELTPDSTDPTTCSVTFPLTKSQRLFLHLEDDAGRVNKQPPEFVMTVTPNRRAELELAFPSRDVEVSPIEELQLTARMWDDYALSRVGLTYQLGDATPQEVTLGTSITTREKSPVSYLLPFEELRAQPNQLLTYYFWAEDIDGNGQRRRTMSDMFFAELRPFDEIYRQGQQPPGESSPEQRDQQQPNQGQQGAGNQVQQLAEQQKEIINATWNILRREESETVSPEFKEDVAVVRDAQSSLRHRLIELAQQIDDAEAQQHITTLTEQMKTAVAELTRATDEALATPLDAAIRAEQGAYQTLLQLRAREHEVIRSNAQSAQQARSAGASGNRSQQQLQQLALSNNENRYETQREAAQQQENPAQSEQRQILNRLRELARRQNDLNKRLQELQAELEQADDAQEREELLKQLKRLREQQQEILRDTDELNSRMNQAEDQQNMSDSQQRLQQAREDVRRASEALKEGRVSQALSSGTRAQRELDELRDDFRKQTSGQFADEARELQRQADELVQKQRELAHKLNPQTPDTTDEPRSLRDASPREEVLQEMQQQNERLDNLLEEMQQTVKEAEEPQPLLAEQLYDSYRQARQERLPEKMQETARSMQRGLLDDTRQLESSAREGIERLRDSVQKAAESVLGDENEALRRARDELNELSQELNEEMRRAAPTRGEVDPATESDRAAPRSNAPGDPSADERTADERRAENADAQQLPPGASLSASDESQVPPGRQQGTQERGQPQRRETQPEPQPAGAQPSAANQLPDATAEGPGEQTRDTNGQQPGNRSGAAEQGEPSGDRQGNEDQQRRGTLRRDPEAAPRLRGGNDADNVQPGRPGAVNEEYRGPLTGSDFRNWADRLRDVEEMISDPELKSEAARIRDRAREIRSDLLRHSQEPNWELVRLTIAQPLSQLHDRIGEELEKRISKTTLVPIDRDPVPTPYVEQVRRYYERIGSGE